MAFSKKVKDGNYGPTKGDGRLKVYSAQFNTLLDDLREFFTGDDSTTIAVDTITEQTADTGVTIDGVLIKDGTITTTAPIINSVDAAITATGVDDTDGYAITEQINVITGGAADTGVELPTAVPGLEITIANLTASVKRVYANASDQIDDEAATTGYVELKPEQVAVFTCYTTALWQSNFEAEAAYDRILGGQNATNL